MATDPPRAEDIRPGDLVKYQASPELKLVGIVVSVNEEISRARVFWQTHNVYKFVGIHELRKL